MNDLVTIKEAAKLMDVKIGSIYKYIRRGWLTTYTNQRGDRRVSKADIEKVLTFRREGINENTN